MAGGIFIPIFKEMAMMLEKQYFGEERTIELSESELWSVIEEAKAAASEELLRENKRLKEMLKSVRTIIELIIDE